MTTSVIKRELERYRENGLFGNIAALAIVAIFIFGWLPFCKLIWPQYMQIGEDYSLLPFHHQSVWLTTQTFTLHWSTCILFYFLYVGKYPLIEQYRAKAHEDERWPWESHDSETWNKMFRRAMWINIQNGLLMNIILTFGIEFLGIYTNHPTGIDEMPSVPVFAAQMIWCCLVEDTLFYFSHRTLHYPYFYRTIHKIHHENKVNYCLAAIYAHPIEYLFGNILPLIAGPELLGHRIHRAASFGWYLIRSTETIDTHCGYSFPWSPYRLLPFQLDQDYHFFHHEVNVGNYATFFTWWDTVFGTNTQFYKSKQSATKVKQEAVKQD